MSTLLEYIETMRKQHKIRIKLACGCSNEMLDKIERHLEKYDAEQISAPQKLILQKTPLDFPQLDKAEVHIIDFVANLPVSIQELHVNLARMLRVPEGYVVVRQAEDPRETQDPVISDKEYTPRLGSDYDKSELSDVKAEELYGDKFNTSFLKELKKLSDDRRKDLPKIVDPDRPAIEPEIGDSARTNKRSPVATRKQ
jgi:hypothetical protein